MQAQYFLCAKAGLDSRSYSDFRTEIRSEYKRNTIEQKRNMGFWRSSQTEYSIVPPCELHYLENECWRKNNFPPAQEEKIDAVRVSC